MNRLQAKTPSGMRVARYGFDSWDKLFTDRQLLTLGTFVREIRAAKDQMDRYPTAWREALSAYLACVLSKLTDYSSGMCSWHNSGEKLRQTFARFALPMVWDFCEVNPLSDTTGGFKGMSDWVARYIDHALSRRGRSSVARSRGTQRHRRTATEPRPHLHRPALLRRDPLFGSDGPLPHMAPSHAPRPLTRIRRCLRKSVGTEVGARCRRRGAY